jgi:hypothetical protein
VTVDVNAGVYQSDQVADALDGVAHHRAADVVGVVVGDEGGGDAHPVGCRGIDQLGGPVGRVDDHGLPGFTVPDEVDEVDHLLGQRVVDGKVPPGQELAEIQLLGHAAMVGACGRMEVGARAACAVWRDQSRRV